MKNTYLRSSFGVNLLEIDLLVDHHLMDEVALHLDVLYLYMKDRIPGKIYCTL